MLIGYTTMKTVTMTKKDNAQQPMNSANFVSELKKAKQCPSIQVQILVVGKASVS